MTWCLAISPAVAESTVSHASSSPIVFVYSARQVINMGTTRVSPMWSKYGLSLWQVIYLTIYLSCTEIHLMIQNLIHIVRVIRKRNFPQKRKIRAPKGKIYIYSK